MTSTFAHCSLFIAHCSLLTVKEAFARVLATARPLPPETLALPEAAGRVLAQSLSADRDFPPFTRVAMDGIALAHAAWAAGQTTFPIEHVQYAGAPARPLKNPRAAMEVMTGAVLPPGTDTVVRYEDLTLSEGRATINIAPPPALGQHTHPQAADRQQGDLLLAAGTRLGPAELAVAATVGAAQVLVTRRARLAVVSTGDELVDIAQTPLPTRFGAPMPTPCRPCWPRPGPKSCCFTYLMRPRTCAAGWPTSWPRASTPSC
jgi:molybdopterin molybdotransferase